jgi:hypothetical protein
MEEYKEPLEYNDLESENNPETDFQTSHLKLDGIDFNANDEDLVAMMREIERLNADRSKVSCLTVFPASLLFHLTASRSSSLSIMR